jgi:hypothetical protein
VISGKRGDPRTDHATFACHSQNQVRRKIAAMTLDDIALDIAKKRPCVGVLQIQRKIDVDHNTLPPDGRPCSTSS